jgi:ribonucleotide reductase alpha subunit
MALSLALAEEQTVQALIARTTTGRRLLHFFENVEYKICAQSNSTTAIEIVIMEMLRDSIAQISITLCIENLVSIIIQDRKGYNGKGQMMKASTV